MNKGVVIGVSLVALLVMGYMYANSGSTVTVNKEDMEQAAKVIISQLDQEAREALPLQLQPNVNGMGLDSTVRGEVLAILKQDLVDLVGSSSPGILDTHLLGNTGPGDSSEPPPGSQEYITVTFKKLMEISGIGTEFSNIHALPDLHEDVLMSMMVYSTERSLPRQAKVFSEVIAYKRLLALGQEMDLDFSEFGPNLALISSSDMPLASMDIDQLRSYLAVFQFPPQYRASFTTIIGVIQKMIEHVENDATQQELDDSLLAIEDSNEAERENAAPGSDLYDIVTNDTLRHMAGDDFPLGDPASLPDLELSVLEELLDYSIRRSYWVKAISFAKTIAYKKVLAIGEREGMDLKPYGPNLDRFSVSSVDYSKVSIATRNEFLEALEETHEIPFPFIKTSVIAEIKRSIAEDGEFINIDEIEYMQETMDHVVDIAGVSDIEDIMPDGVFDTSLDMDLFFQIRDYALTREDTILEGKASDAMERKRLLAVGDEIGIDLSVVEVWTVDLESLSVAQMVKLYNVLRGFRVISNTVNNFLIDLTTIKERKAQEAVVSQNLADEAEEDAHEQAKEEAQEEAEVSLEPDDDTIQQLVENEPVQQTQQNEPVQQTQQNEPVQQTQQNEPVQQEPEVTEAINNIRSDKTNRVGVETRHNDNGSVFVDLSVPSDIDPSETDKITIFFTSESWTTLGSYNLVFEKIKGSESLEGLSTEEINVISSAGVVFDEVSKSYIRQMTVRINERVSELVES